MKIKYVDYELPSGSKEFAPWNTMTFFGCKVLNINTVEYKAGRRMTIEIEAPKLKKKYYLYAWSDAGACEAIEKSGLKVGDYISCHTELSYYQNKDGRHCEAYKIIGNAAYDSRIPENEHFFKFMVIKRETKANAPVRKASYMSTNDILKKMLG